VFNHIKLLQQPGNGHKHPDKSPPPGQKPSWKKYKGKKSPRSNLPLDKSPNGHTF